MNGFFLACLLLVLAGPVSAQSNLTGLGPFVLGVTTPDSLNRFRFSEQELVVVKGTLALPCTGIRVFRADTCRIPGLSVANLYLVFYEDRLFRITCAYDATLQKRFVEQHGKSSTTSTSAVSLCGEEGESKRLILKSQGWQNNRIRALAVWATGYNDRCQPVQVSRLTIASQPVVAITSECDLDALDPYIEKLWNKP